MLTLPLPSVARRLGFIALLLALGSSGFAQAPVAINVITPRTPAPAAARENRIIIKAKSGTPEQALAALHRRAGAGKSRALHRVGLHAVELPRGLDRAAALAAYRANPAIEYAEPDYLLQTLARPNDTNYLNLDQWNLHNTGIYGGVAGADIMAEAAWDLRTDASNIIVAVIDTGIRYTHQDLAANMWVNPGESGNDSLGRDKRTNGVDDDANGYVDDVHGINLLNDSGNPMDEWGHGTHVAGIIGGVGNNGTGIAGIAWKVRLMAIKFIDNSANYSISDAIAGMEYAQRHGAKIVTASWGNYSFNSTALRDAITSLRDAGIIMAAAAGNDGANNDVTPLYPASYPLDNIVAVAATDRTDNRVGWSNYGPNTVHIGAPGSPVWSTFAYSDSSYQYYDGTSMAAPHIAGAAALIWARFPTYTHQQVIQRILSTVDVLPSLNGRTKSGGRLNLAAALAGTATPPAAPAAPTALAAVASTGPRVDLSWQDQSNNETGFQIERSTDQTNYTTVGSVGANVRNYADTAVSAGTTYSYRVRAVAGSLVSAYSNVATATTVAPPQTVAAPSSLSASALSSTEVNLSWTDHSNNETGFQIERSTDQTNFVLVTTTSANAVGFRDTGRAASTTYYYRVRAVGSTATSAYSNIASATTSAPAPTAPAAPSVLAGTANSASQVTLTWQDNASNETGFEIQRSTDNVTFAASGTVGANATSFTVTSLNAATTYYFRVRAVAGSAVSAYSNTATVTTSMPPQPAGSAWATSDVGPVGSVVALSHTGAGFSDTTDAFAFRSLKVSGDVDIIARVAAISNSHSSATAGLMLRESLATNARYALVRVTAGGSTALLRRTAAGGGTATTAGAINASSAWLRIKRVGNTVTAYESTTGTTWTAIGTVTLDLSTPFYVGLAVSSYNSAAVCTATFDNVALVQGTVVP